MEKAVGQQRGSKGVTKVLCCRQHCTGKVLLLPHFPLLLLSKVKRPTLWQITQLLGKAVVSLLTSTLWQTILYRKLPGMKFPCLGLTASADGMSGAH